MRRPEFGRVTLRNLAYERRIAVLRKLFGSFEPSPWASAPSGLRDHVAEKLSGQQLVELERVLLKHRIISRVKEACWQVDAPTQAQVLSLALLDAHWDFVSKNPKETLARSAGSSSDGQKEARWLVYLSVHLNPEPWNPAWSWNLYFGADDLSDAQKKTHVDYTLQASDTAGYWYSRLLGREPAYELVYPFVRALAVHMAMESVLGERLTQADREAYSAVMAQEIDGLPVERVILRMLAAVPMSSEETVAYGLRLASHSVHLAGQVWLSKFDFRNVLLYERCAAAINPQHLPARSELASLLRELDSVDPESGYADEARRYAREAVVNRPGFRRDPALTRPASASLAGERTLPRSRWA